ncbi:SpoIIE family protein phosphatase [Streptomyces alkaliphilus]|uniref:protein-serine/threonine phosphatase n=1 Tax=Streptomyces alkaliphilus TaxID=1472722 RepID=A0A7W3TAE3_9ACTN|nr:SpoIIE family protein phosphatase [Streptomyces alkaliphilus]MBB0243216.1 SpoIIE family protein phosphatase [Streptomyces alkaliphilus]
MRSADVLTAVDTGLWQWDHATGLVTLDTVAARLMGLPPRPTTLSETAMRGRVHVEDWIDLHRVAGMAAAENRTAEVRFRVMARKGHLLRTLRARIRSKGDNGDFALSGLIEEVEEIPCEEGRRSGDWRLAREAFLLDAGRALAEARTTGEVLRVAGRLALPGFTPNGLVVFGTEGERLCVLGYHGYPVTTPEDEARVKRLFRLTVGSNYPAAEVIRTGRALYIHSPAEYERRFPEAWQVVRGFGRKSWAYLPLIAGGRTLGAWLAGFPDRVSFTPDERSVLTTVARMLAQALARTHTLESERELSADLQHTMAPLGNPEVPGVQITTRYVPTGGGLQIGGDWYDVIPLPSGRLALVIGDVQGHDVRAAAIMAQLRIALRAYASEGHRPDAVLSRASRFLCGVSTGTDPRFATCLYLEVDPRTGTLDVARAGHPDLAVRLPDGSTALRPTAGGPPLGVIDDWAYPTTRISLQPEEVLLMCTDGLLETGGHDLHTGWIRLRAILESRPVEDLEKLADSVVEAVHGPSSHRLTGPLTDRREDDIALVMLRRPAPLGARALRRTVLTVDQAEPARIAEARHQLAGLLRDWSDPEQVDGAVLMLSEMLTNVLVHTDSDAMVVAELSGPMGERLLRVEVTDTSDELPHRREPGELASSGRGLLLMESLSDAWGVDPRGDGKTTWFELGEPAPAADAAGGPDGAVESIGLAESLGAADSLAPRAESAPSRPGTAEAARVVTYLPGEPVRAADLTPPGGGNGSVPSSTAVNGTPTRTSTD